MNRAGYERAQFGEQIFDIPEAAVEAEQKGVGFVDLEVLTLFLLRLNQSSAGG